MLFLPCSGVLADSGELVVPPAATEPAVSPGAISPAAGSPAPAIPAPAIPAPAIPATANPEPAIPAPAIPAPALPTLSIPASAFPAPGVPGIASSADTAPGATPAAASPAADELSELLATFKEKVDALESQRQRSQIPVGHLAGELEEARRDIERMAELLLRKEITGYGQRAAMLVAEQKVETLNFELDGVRAELDLVTEERNRMGQLVADSTSRVQELAGQLVAIDEERLELEKMLLGSREEAKTARTALAAADARVQEINTEMQALEARNEAARAAYEQRVFRAEASVAALGERLSNERSSFERELAGKDENIRVLERRQMRVRDVLAGALAEIDAASERVATSAYEREMLRAADASVEARETILDNMGFRRDDSGELLPPAMNVASSPAAIEPAAGPVESCPSLGPTVTRAYLDDQAAEDWQHFIVGTLRFEEARADLDTAQLAAIAGCLAALSASPTHYFKIIGHTDSLGTAAYNQRLSLARAQAARDLFLEKVAIQPWRLFAQGRGESHPIASNDSDAGRAVNRRVEVFAVKAPH